MEQDIDLKQFALLELLELCVNKFYKQYAPNGAFPSFWGKLFVELKKSSVRSELFVEQLIGTSKKAPLGVNCL